VTSAAVRILCVFQWKNFLLQLVFASSHVFSICHVFLSERSQAPFLFSTVSNFVCTCQVLIFQSMSAVLSLHFSEARQLDFLFRASNPGSVRSHIEGCSPDFAHCN
jgi:hypothetical protein